jgi:hypothetical protein
MHFPEYVLYEVLFCTDTYLAVIFTTIPVAQPKISTLRTQPPIIQHIPESVLFTFYPHSLPIVSRFSKWTFP